MPCCTLYPRHPFCHRYPPVADLYPRYPLTAFASLPPILIPYAPPPPHQAGGGVDNKTAKLALATLFLNFAVAAHQEPLTGNLGDAYQQLAALYAEVLGAVTPTFADDALYRVLVGLGTLVTVSRISK